MDSPYDIKNLEDLHRVQAELREDMRDTRELINGSMSGLSVNLPSKLFRTVAGPLVDQVRHGFHPFRLASRMVSSYMAGDKPTWLTMVHDGINIAYSVFSKR